MASIKVIRRYNKDTYCIGDLYIDDVFVCTTREDRDRGLDSMMTTDEISKKKVYGQTAIPTGVYALFMKQVSPKFRYASWAKPYGGCVPRLLNVKGYDGVLLHCGNGPEDTLGCILVGENKVKGKVINSAVAFHKVMSILDKDDVATHRIEIIRAYSA